MALSFGQLVLYSRNPRDLAKFLAELLDLEMHQPPQGDGILLRGSLIKISIVTASAQHLFSKGNDRDLMMDFSVESLDELEDFLHKIQFMNYRHGEESPQGPKVQLSKVGKTYFFLVKDIDGRKWKFSYREE